MLLHGRLVPLALLLLLGLSAFAQQQLPPASETIDVSIINLDVFVTDKKGNRVDGLTLDDLENARDSHFTYNATVEVDRFADAISVGVRDDVSKEYGLVRIAIPAREGVKEKRGGSLE